MPPLKSLVTKTLTEIPDHITPGAKLLLVATSPSIDEIKSKDFFSSKGKLKLLKMLSLVGLTRNDVSIVNIFPYHPKGGKLAGISYNEHKVRYEILKRKIISLNPTLIIALDEVPMKALTVGDNITKYRGSVLACTLVPSYKVLITYDPYEVYITPKNDYEYQYDFLRIPANLKSKTIIRKTINIHIEDNLDVFRSIFLAPSYLSNPESLLSFDIECIGPDLVSISFSSDENSAWVLPLHDFKINKFVEALRLINDILKSKVKKVAQNGNFDILYLGYYYNIKVCNFHFDTMLAQHSLYSNTPKGLDFLASIYTNEPYWKDEGKQWKSKNINWKEFYEYNGKDSVNTLEIATAQLPLLHERKVYNIFLRSMALCYSMITIEWHGMLVDKKIQQTLCDENAEIYRKLELVFHTFVGYELNVKSPKQVAKYLYEELKLPKKYKKGKLTTGEDALNSLLIAGGTVIRLILLLRDYGKRDTFYNIKISPDGRARTTLKIGGTETGRLSSSKSITGTGSNYQNQPPRARRLYVPDPGHLMINVDYSKAESWIVAHLANDQQMIDALNGPDFHVVNASNILNLPVDKITKKERQIGKKISHACNYGVTAFTFQKALAKEGYKYSKSQCQDLLDAYFIAYPKVKAFQASIRTQLSRTMSLTNIFGRKITYFAHWGDNLFRSAYSYIPQGSVGDMTNQGLKNIYDELSLPVDILLQIHDAVLMQVKYPLITQELIDTIHDLMSFEITIKQHKIKIPVDVDIGPNWYNLYPWDNYRNNFTWYDKQMDEK